MRHGRCCQTRACIGRPAAPAAEPLGRSSDVSRSEVQLSQDTVQEFALSDARLLGIRWSADGIDFMLDLELGDGRASTLRCEWATAVRIDLHANTDELGEPLSWECSWKEVDDLWQMLLSFASRGTIELDCQQAVLVYDAG